MLINNLTMHKLKKNVLGGSFQVHQLEKHSLITVSVKPILATSVEFIVVRVPSIPHSRSDSDG